MTRSCPVHWRRGEYTTSRCHRLPRPIRRNHRCCRRRSRRSGRRRCRCYSCRRRRTSHPPRRRSGEDSTAGHRCRRYSCRRRRTFSPPRRRSGEDSNAGHRCRSRCHCCRCRIHHCSTPPRWHLPYQRRTGWRVRPLRIDEDPLQWPLRPDLRLPGNGVPDRLRLATAVARRSDHAGMRLQGDGPASRSAEATEMAVLSTSCAVPLKPPWRATDIGQMPVPSASRTFVFSAHRYVRWDRRFFLVVRGIFPAVPRSSRPRLWSSTLV